MAAPKYKPLDFSSDLTIDAAVAYGQAAQALDSAATIAIASADAESLTTVAALWMRVGESLLGDAEEEESDEDEAEHKPHKLGFHNDHKENDDE